MSKNRELRSHSLAQGPRASKGQRWDFNSALPGSRTTFLHLAAFRDLPQQQAITCTPGSQGPEGWVTSCQPPEAHRGEGRSGDLDVPVCTSPGLHCMPGPEAPGSGDKATAAQRPALSWASTLPGRASTREVPGKHSSLPSSSRKPEHATPAPALSSFSEEACTTLVIIDASALSLLWLLSPASACPLT